MTKKPTPKQLATNKQFKQSVLITLTAMQRALWHKGKFGLMSAEERGELGALYKYSFKTELNCDKISVDYLKSACTYIKNLRDQIDWVEIEEEAKDGN